MEAKKVSLEDSLCATLKSSQKNLDQGNQNTANLGMTENDDVKAGNRLLTSWTLWADKKMTTKIANNHNNNFDEYSQNLKNLGTFETVEGFWRHYAWLKSPDELPRDTDYFCFRNQSVPAWETFPHGGCWIVKVRKKNGVISRLWEELLFAAVGELFDTPDVVGVTLSVRTRDDNLSIWNKTSNSDVKIMIGEKLKDILHLDESTTLHYQDFKDAMKYGSSFRQAKPYVFAAAPPVTQNFPAPETLVGKDGSL